MGNGYKDPLDLTFFTNDENGSLLDRFRRVLKNTRYFDILVGYFRASVGRELCLEMEPNSSKHENIILPRLIKNFPLFFNSNCKY